MSIIPRLNRLLAIDGCCFDVAIDHGFFNERAFLSLASPIRSCRYGQHSVTNSRILRACVNHFTVLHQKKLSKAIEY